jgi:hypothetical protein
MRAWAAGVLLLPERLAGALMSTDRSTPFWDSLMRWSRRLGT